MLAEREIRRAYVDANPLIINVGLLTGSHAMTGIAPVAQVTARWSDSLKGLPAAMMLGRRGASCSTSSKWTELDELVIWKRQVRVYIVIRETGDRPEVTLKPADHLLGMTTHEKIMALQEQYDDAHFAAIGTAGENWQNVYAGAVALSTVNQLKSKQDKVRFAGRGGMGSLMGYKNVLALVAQSSDKLGKTPEPIKKANINVIKGGGSARLQPIKRGGGGGTWAASDVLQAFHAVPVNNFRPQGNDLPELLFRTKVEQQYEIKSEACYRCGITCHNNIHERNADGSPGAFLAKFDYEPLNLLGTNLGLHEAASGSRP